MHVHRHSPQSCSYMDTVYINRSKLQSLHMATAAEAIIAHFCGWEVSMNCPGFQGLGPFVLTFPLENTELCVCPCVWVHLHVCCVHMLLQPVHCYCCSHCHMRTLST